MISYRHFKRMSLVDEILEVFGGIGDEGYLKYLLVFGSILLGILFLNPLPGILLFSITITYLGIALLFAPFKSRQKLRLDASGIDIPKIDGVTEGIIGKKTWRNLESILFRRDGFISDDPLEMMFCFKDGRKANFNIDGFTRESLEELISYALTFNPDLKIEPDPKQSKFGSTGTLSVGKLGIEALTFTSLWNKELGSRFGSTAFVPLSKGVELVDGLYRVIGQIASGGLSAIYLAFDRDGRRLVLKESVPPDSCDDESRAKALELFQRECRLLATIDHPRIAKVYDYFVEQNRHYMVLQYIEGTNLREFIRCHGPQ
ncbi:MAG: protein kinase, partial [Candidatus Obscuribacterales bacterium]|nr:protein kinase [Candidatus Obscuribacterales bacterium]